MYDTSKWRLYFVDVYGKGDGIRMLFHKVGEEFEDLRYQYHEFITLQHQGYFKKKFEFGQIPVVEKDGKTYA